MKALEGKIKVMSHFLNGGEIEWMSKDDPHATWKKWFLSEEPSWDWVKYDYRILISPKFRLPTKEEFKNLHRHFSRWNEETKELEVMNEKGELLFFPSNGYKNDISTNEVGDYGYCWSSTASEQYSDVSYFFSFNEDIKTVTDDYQFYGFNVRLVSDTPFGGGIEFNGLYWKPENEEGFYTWPEAMDKFNKQ